MERYIALCKPYSKIYTPEYAILPWDLDIGNIMVCSSYARSVLCNP